MTGGVALGGARYGACLVGDILLVRHGQSEWNALGRWQGQADPSLSPLGRLQALHAAGRLGAFDALVSSDLQRAAETADIIASERSCSEPTREPGLRERAAGPWEGLTHDEIEAGWPGYLESGRRPDGYEQDHDLVERVAPVLRRLAAAGSALVVVTHGGVLRAMERQFGEDRGPIPNLGGCWWHVDAATLVPGERVVLVPEGEITRPEET